MVAVSPRAKIPKTSKADFTVLTVVVASLVVQHQNILILNETDVITDIAVLHMGTNDIINSEVNKDLAVDRIINTVRECVAFGVKSVFVSSLMVNT